MKLTNLRAKGKTLREIATALKIPRATVARVLSQNGPYKTASNGSGKTGRKNTQLVCLSSILFGQSVKVSLIEYRRAL